MLQAGWSAKEYRGEVEDEDGNLSRNVITNTSEYQAKESGLDLIGNRELLQISEQGRHD